MPLFEQLDNWFVGHVSFPVTNYAFNRKGVMADYLGLIRSERYSEGQLREIQFRKVQRLLSYANRCVPYYAQKFKEIGLTPQDTRSLEDLALIPALSRQEVIEHCDDLVKSDFRASLGAAKQSKSGPGQPL